MFAVPLQWSACVQSLPSLHDLVAAAKPSAGQAPEVPVQLSSTSHWPAEAQHTKVLGLKASTHELLVPVQ